MKLVLSKEVAARIEEVKKAMEYAKKMSKSPTLYQLLFPAN